MEGSVDILLMLVELLEIFQRLSPSLLDPLRSSQSDFKLSVASFLKVSTDSVHVAQLRNRWYLLLLQINDHSFSVENVSPRKLKH